MTNCPTCGHVNSFGSTYCSQCATRLSSASTPIDPAAPRPFNSPYVPYAAAQPASASGTATATLVLGILSLVVCAVMGPIAWAMGRGELNRIKWGEAPQAGHGLATAGMICGIVGTVILGLSLIWVVIFFSSFRGF